MKIMTKSIEEQRRIVAKIEELAGKIEEARSQNTKIAIAYNQTAF
jgi:hypothetical protein